MLAPALSRLDDPWQLPDVDDSRVYYETGTDEVDGERLETGLWHDFGFGNRMKLRPRYE